jgi:hypothetical protein
MPAEEDIPMLIKVRYKDNSCGMVDSSLLDKLTSNNEITEFLRSSGWVRLGRDPVRGHVIGHLSGDRLERRRKDCMLNTYV